MGLNHDFLLISEKEFDEKGYLPYLHSAQATLLHDDLISYIFDSLLWIPAYNGGKNKEPLDVSKGFNRWGISLYKKDGALKLHKVFTAWADLFAQGHEELVLTGHWTWTQGKKPEEGHYERLLVPRDKTIQDLMTIADWAKQVVDSHSDLCILHLGI